MKFYSISKDSVEEGTRTFVNSVLESSQLQIPFLPFLPPNWPHGIMVVM